VPARCPSGPHRRRAAGVRIVAIVKVLLLVAVSALLLVRTADAQVPAAPSSPPAFARAYALQTAGEFAQAAEAYAAFLQEYPDNVEARSNLGVVLARLGRTEEAVAAYRAALARSPAQQAIRLNLGLALYKAARFDEAADTFATVVAAQPVNLQARYLEADCLLRLGKPEAVIAALEPVAASREGDRVVAYLLGMAYLRTNQPQRGQVLIDRIMSKGDSAEARLLMGMAKRAVKDLAGGLEDLERAVELNPDLPGVHTLYGQALLETGNRDLAVRELEAEFARNPTDFEANLLLGMLAREDFAFDKARAHLQRALAMRPGHIAVRFQLAAIHVSLGEAEAAKTILEAIVTEAPTFVEARVSLATVYYRLKLRDLGDKERAAVDELNRQAQARQPGAAPSLAQPASSGTPPP
jgi:tetratricopeptide (TPR) repeat protein